MKISEYPEVTTTQPEDKFIVSTTDGTKSIKSENVRINGIPEEFTIVPFVEDPIVLHSSHFRGKNLGNEVTEEQIQAIQNGTFDDLWIGDYWEINNTKWRIADIDFYRQTNSSHHIVLIPDTYVASVKPSAIGWSSVSTHLAPLMYDYLQNNKNAIVPSAISKYMKNVEVKRYSESLNTTATANTINFTRVNTSIFLPEMSNICGSWTAVSSLKIVPGVSEYNHVGELKLFKLNKSFVKSNQTYQVNLAIIHSSTMYNIGVNGYSQLTLGQMTDTLLFRPLVIIGA